MRYFVIALRSGYGVMNAKTGNIEHRAGKKACRKVAIRLNAAVRADEPERRHSKAEMRHHLFISKSEREDFNYHLAHGNIRAAVKAVPIRRAWIPQRSSLIFSQMTAPALTAEEVALAQPFLR